jgi:hypothetical protein
MGRGLELGRKADETRTDDRTLKLRTVRGAKGHDEGDN